MPPRRKKEETCVAEATSRGGKYLQRMKISDPERYKCHLAKEAARNKKVRSQLSEEKRIIQREQTRIRVQKLREKIRSEKQTEVRKEFKKKIKDMTPEERKEYDRVRKSESRAKMTHQKKRRVREREKKYREKRNNKKKQLQKPEENTQNMSSPITPSVRVLTSRIRKRLPKSSKSKNIGSGILKKKTVRT